MSLLRALSWVFPLAVGVGLLGLGIARPWTGSYDANGALFSTVARNSLRYGLVATRGGQVANAGQLAPSDFRFYTHHPPGLPLTMAASFAAFGVHEWSARLVPILFTLGSAMALYLVARELAGAWAGFFAALLFVVQPMVAFYGRMPDHEAPGAFFALALTGLYLRWRRAAGRRWVAWMCLAGLLGVWYAWIVFLVPWVLLAHAFLCRRSSCGTGDRMQAGACGRPVAKGDLRDEKEGIPSRRCETFGREGARGAASMWWPVLAAALGFLTVLGHIALVEGGLGELWAALVHRLSAQAADRGGDGTFSILGFLVRQYEYFVTAFPVTLLVPCAAWALGIGRRTRADTGLIVALAAVALLGVLGFRQGAYVHVYYQFYLAIPLALASGMTLAGLVRLSARCRSLAAVVILLAAIIGFEGWQKLAAIREAIIPEYADQVAVAHRIRDGTKPEDRILVIWKQRTSFRQLAYYADRNVTVPRVTPDDIVRGYMWGWDWVFFVGVRQDTGQLEIGPVWRGHMWGK